MNLHETLGLDNHDPRIKFYELLLERKDLDGIPEYALPEGYRFVFYKSGDRDKWIEIEKSAKELQSYEQGLQVWEKYYGGKDTELYERMVFIENENGEKVATATAFYDIHGRDRSGAGWLHWVAVRREYQGKGLSKPLISHVLGVMRSLGYTHAKIPTQTTTWLACRIYLDFGFAPIPQNAVNSRAGWEIIKALTDHPSLAEFDSAELDEILIFQNVKWLFFDVGSTLIDETEAYSHRIRDVISGTDITFEQFSEKRIYFAKKNLKGDLEAIKFFGLKNTPWHKEDEKPYPEAEQVLKYLSEKGYKIGIIANQSAGTAERLKNWGLLKYIDVVAASAEEGVAKPDKEIFFRALKRAECSPENAVMVGDRLDNDIFPAKKLGMKTIWVKQGMAAYGSPVSKEETPDCFIGSISELTEIF